MKSRREWGLIAAKPNEIRREIDVALAYFRDVEVAVLEAERLGWSRWAGVEDARDKWTRRSRTPPLDAKQMIWWLSRRSSTLDQWPPPLTISAHGHFGGLDAIIDVAEAVGFGVAGNMAYAGLVSAVRKLRSRRRIRLLQKRRQFVLDLTEAIELATEVIRIADHKQSRNTAKRRAKRAQIDHRSRWHVVFSELDGERDDYRVIIPKGDPKSVEITIVCETCIRQEEEDAEDLARLILEKTPALRDRNRRGRL